MGDSLGEVQFYEQFAGRLAAMIDALGVSRAAAAREIGVSPQRLNGWLSGAHQPNVYLLAQWCRRRGSSLDWLFLGDPAGLKKALADSLLAAS